MHSKFSLPLIIGCVGGGCALLVMAIVHYLAPELGRGSLRIIGVTSGFLGIVGFLALIVVLATSDPHAANMRGLRRRLEEPEPQAKASRAGRSGRFDPHDGMRVYERYSNLDLATLEQDPQTAANIAELRRRLGES